MTMTDNDIIYIMEMRLMYSPYYNWRSAASVAGYLLGRLERNVNMVTVHLLLFKVDVVLLLNIHTDSAAVN